MAHFSQVPAIRVNSNIFAQEGGLLQYLQEIKKIPMLKPQEEYDLAVKYKSTGDREAAHKLVTSHLRLVVKIAMGYRGYGLPIGEVISEGSIGLMHAVKRFQPERGFRLATYAMWWIKSSIQEYIIRSWSLVKIGTTINQKRLFFNLRKLKNKIQAFDDAQLDSQQVQKIAKDFKVSEAEVVSMNQRLIGDASLNAPLRIDQDAQEWQDCLPDQMVDQENALIEADEKNFRRAILEKAIATLNAREQDIFRARRLNEVTTTLEQLSAKYNISRERVRQIEAKAFEKVQKEMKAMLLSQ